MILKFKFLGRGVMDLDKNQVIEIKMVGYVVIK